MYFPKRSDRHKNDRQRSCHWRWTSDTNHALPTLSAHTDHMCFQNQENGTDTLKLRSSSTIFSSQTLAPSTKASPCCRLECNYAKSELFNKQSWTKLSQNSWHTSAILEVVDISSRSETKTQQHCHAPTLPTIRNKTSHLCFRKEGSSKQPGNLPTNISAFPNLKCKIKKLFLKCLIHVLRPLVLNI
jgi:hypothetical protein